MTKVFRIECTIQTNEKSITLKKTITQTNQKSKMNVISKSLRKQLKIFRKKFSNIKFHEFIMRTADFRNTLFEYWIEFLITISEIVRIIKCFVSSDVFISKFVRSEHYNLLLKFFWLFSVNAVIHIRESKIIIENSVQKKFMKKIVKSKMIFCTKHILIMYFVKAFFKAYRSKKKKTITMKAVSKTNHSKMIFSMLMMKFIEKIFDRF